MTRSANNSIGDNNIFLNLTNNSFIPISNKKFGGFKKN